MAEVVQEKSRGLKFAEQQLLRHGWEHGKGLGRAENGISEPIKVKVKCDKGGVGHKEGEQFSFHWWDHVFNKASSSLQVETNQNGIKLKTTTDEGDETTISNKKPRKALLQRNKLYGCFVKSATLLSGQEQPEPKESVSDDDSSSDEEEEQNLDLSSTTKLSDSDLMRVCGGRTAHKGARHGLTMSAKLARLEQQEAEFMAKYGKTKSSSTCITTTPPTSQMEEATEERRRKKMKKKRSREKSDEINDDGVCNSPEVEVQQKKKTKKKKDETEERVSTEGDEICMENQGERRSKRRENMEQNGDAESKRQELNSEVKKKKKKKKKSSSCDVEPAEEESKESETLEEKQVGVKTEKQKRKKNKKLSEETVEEEESPPKKKKKSKDQ